MASVQPNGAASAARPFRVTARVDGPTVSGNLLARAQQIIDQFAPKKPKTGAFFLNWRYCYAHDKGVVLPPYKFWPILHASKVMAKVIDGER
jgi:hypothetical protein